MAHLVEQDAGLEGCLKFLKGNSDEQRLVGLLLATKHVQGDDKESIMKVFDAIGVQFINRLLKSGGKTTSHEAQMQEQPYTQLAISVLAAFCRVPELASMDTLIDKVPVLLEVLKSKSTGSVAVDCFECLLGIGSASSRGLVEMQQKRAFSVALQYLAGANSADTALFCSIAKVTQMLLGAGVSNEEIIDSADDLTLAISVLAQQLASKQGASKFDALLVLRMICSPQILIHIDKSKLHDADWLKSIRTGIGHILQSRVVFEQKHLALELIECIVGLLGGSWLLGPVTVVEESMAVDRFFMLFIESLRVETVVLLNEAAWLLDSDYAGSTKSKEALRRQRILATCYSLWETVLTVISEETDEAKLSDLTLQKTLSAINETMSTVIDFLQEAKAQNVTKSDVLIASVCLLGRYIVDAPPQSKLRKQFLMLLEYLLSIISEHEESPFLAVQLTLPALCQVTLDKEGCKALTSWGGHKQIINLIVSQTNGGSSGVIAKACDVILNLLQQENRIGITNSPRDFLPLVSVLPSWAVQVKQSLEISLVSCICALVLDLSNEDTMLQMTSAEVLSCVYDLIVRILCYTQESEEMVEPANEEDLWDLTISVTCRILDRYPSLNHTLRSSHWLARLLRNRPMLEAAANHPTRIPSLQLLLRGLLDH